MYGVRYVRYWYVAVTIGAEESSLRSPRRFGSRSPQNPFNLAVAVVPILAVEVAIPNPSVTLAIAVVIKVLLLIFD